MNRPKSDAAPRGGGAGVRKSNSRPKCTAAILRLRPDPAGLDHYGRTPEVRLRLRRVVTLDVPPAAAADQKGGDRHGR